MTEPTSRQGLPRSRSGVALGILRSAVAIGVSTGLIEALSLEANQALLGRVIFTSDHILWMTPLLYVLIFLVPGSLLALVAAVAYPRVRRSAATGVLVAFAVLCLFIPYTQIARWAAAIVAAGAGVQAARLVDARPAGVRRAGRILAGGLAALSMLLFGLGQLRGRPALPDAAADPGAPNIVLLVWDTVRAENLSLYGYPEPTTPGLERLAADGITFDRAISPSPWTLPGHGSMFTGRWPHELSTTWLDALDDTYPTVAEVLAGHGYATGGFVANHHYTSRDSGLDRGFSRYADYRVTWRQFFSSSWVTQTGTGQRLLTARSPGAVLRALGALDFWTDVKRWNHRKHASEANAEMLDWLDEIGDRPFFAFLNLFDAHQAYWSPPGYLERFHAEDEGVRAYDAAIAYLDAQLDELLDELERRGLRENTVIVVTSDHGELFGSNGLYGHAHNLYYRTLHVPLVIHGPGHVAPGVRVDRAVSTRHLAATLLELAGVDAQEAGVEGASLSRFWTDAPLDSVPRPVLAEVRQGRNNPPTDPISRGPMGAIIQGRLHYILNGDGIEELYDYVADPREERDLSAEAPEDVARLRRRLEAMRTRR